MGKSLAAWSVLLAAVGCGGEPLDPGSEGVVAVGTEEAPLYVLSTALWEPGRINVCWLPGIGSTADKDVVRKGIRNSWQAVANVSFVGWGSCPSSGFTGIAIKPGSFNQVVGGLGRQADGVSDMELDFSATPQNTWTQCTDNALGRSDCIRVTAIHEFGHSLSFAHEQNRPDNNGACTEGVGSGSNGDTLVGSFDTDSIMSYCGNGMTLTRGDVAGVVEMYGLAPALQLTVNLAGI